jgi:hypothetical protein
LTAHGVKDATTDAAAIEEWWRRWPLASVAIACGAQSGVWVLDVDKKSRGLETIAALKQEHDDELMDALVVTTGAGGQHLYWRWPDEGSVRTRVNARLGLDVRAEGGYVIAPPSGHISGTNYAWLLDSEEGAALLVPAPGWLLAMVRESGRSGSRSAPSNPLDGVCEGERNGAAASYAGSLLRRGLEVEEAWLVLCGWNERNKPPLAEKELRRVLESISRYEVGTAARVRREIDQEDDLLLSAQVAASEHAEGRRNDTSELRIDAARKSGRRLDRDEVIDSVSNFLGLPIVRWIRYGDAESGRYELILADGRRVQLGTIKEVLSPWEFNSRWFAATNIFVPSATRKKRWQPLHEGLAQILEVEDADVSEIDETLEMVADAIGGNGLLDIDARAVKPEERRSAIESGMTIIEGGIVRVRQMAIDQHLGAHVIKIPNLRARLQRAGFRRKPVGIRLDNGRTSTRSYWCREVWDSVPTTPQDGPK